MTKEMRLRVQFIENETLPKKFVWESKIIKQTSGKDNFNEK